MARLSHIVSSSESESEPGKSPQSEDLHQSTAKANRRSKSVSAHRFEESVQKQEPDQEGENDPDNTIVVMVPVPKNPKEFVPYTDDTVTSVLEELTGNDGEILYRVAFEDERQENVTFNRLLHLPNGKNSLDIFNGGESSESVAVDRAGKRARYPPSNKDMVDFTNFDLRSEDDNPKKRGRKQRIVKDLSTADIKKARRSTRVGSLKPSRLVHDDDDEDGSESEVFLANTHQSRRAARPLRKAAPRRANESLNYTEEDEDELAGNGQVESEGSEIAYAPNKSRGNITSAPPSKSRPSRTSGRENKTGKNMKERDIDEELFADEPMENGVAKVVSIREIYQPIPAKSPFGSVHDQDCDVCGGSGNASNKGPSDLIYCQGCSSSIHKLCLGYRAGREHIVTKVGHEHFVMQCRRCINLANKKDPMAPKLGTCSSCHEPGLSCAAFSPKKTAKQEEKLREENNGDDPITAVRADFINNPANVLFRCRGCHRGFHFDHLPPFQKGSSSSKNAKDLRAQRFDEYTKDWQCKECSQTTTKLQTLVAWRPIDRNSYNEGDDYDDFREDQKEYLIKWDDKSYFKCSWMPGSWVWGTAAASMRKAFRRRDEGANRWPIWTEEEAVSEEYLRMEIVFDVEYEDSFQPKSEEHDKAHIASVVQVLVKFRGLTYDESVWEEPPSPNDADRWSDFVSAYNEYVMGKYFKQSPAGAVKQRLDAFRSLNFQKEVFLKKQPDSLTGGEMMQHQMEGLNWLLYNFHQKKNVILADEMGLGKTIQVISLIASLVKDKPKCSPFLIVTPNSTCPNWRREIKKWAPGLRVVAYYGARSARDMAMKYEMYPNGCSHLCAHVVITSFEAPVDDSSRAFFKKVKWAGMIVDEGQRLKNDGNLLYTALTALRVPFQVLLTGTPLQNNKRELFNLLQFLDGKLDAAQLDVDYNELTKENLPTLHNLIRPFFLRRTKLEVLKFLPPMAQTIIPISMSVVQKQLYKSILAKNPELINSIIGKTSKTLKPTERGNLNNILMQLRKCLCHPFLYSSAIEERALPPEALHRNLIDASSKFQLLEIMLPKLQARGHRVLIFSQFLKQLDLVEDFLNGLNLPFQRLDGTISTLEKQKRIDAFNAPNSKLFAFLLSTRAGGTGINMASADTVIIMDPDFNPHQDQQALARAHRIGQTKKVLVFQLVTKDSAEEQIVQVGRKKMALDHALIESMGVDDDAGSNLEEILRHGAEAVLLDDNSKDIHYDSASVDEFLDRSQVENPATNDDDTVKSQFSHARVWIKDKGDLSDDFGDSDDKPAAPGAEVWEAILKQRAEDTAIEAAKNMQTFGRGKRARQTVEYNKSQPELNELDDPEDSPPRNGRRTRNGHSDDEFDGPGAKESEAEDSDTTEPLDPKDLKAEYFDWRQEDTYNKGIFPNLLAVQNWNDRGERLFEKCNRQIQESKGLDKNKSNANMEIENMQRLIRSRIDEPHWWHDQKKEEPTLFSRIPLSLPQPLAPKRRFEDAQMQDNGEEHMQNPSKKLKTANSQAVQPDARIIEQVEKHFRWLARKTLTRPLGDNGGRYPHPLSEFLTQLSLRLKKTTRLADDFEEHFRIQRPRDVLREHQDKAYKRRLAARQAVDTWTPIENHAPHIQNLDRRLQDTVEQLRQEIMQASQQLMLFQHRGLADSAQRLMPQPLPEGTASAVMQEHLRTMSRQLVGAIVPMSSSGLATLSGPVGSSMPLEQHSGGPIELDSDSEVPMRSSPSNRAIPSIEIPVKSKLGRPSGSMTSRPAVSSSYQSHPATPIPSSRIGPNACPECNSLYLKLVPECPCKASVVKIRYMIDNLNGIKNDPQQVAEAKKLLNAALASKLVLRK
ncbi:hypothetical protein EYC80_004602 [Monilinia laxa]|uniref:PHD-type domain-containing protein n=1 Tax=Monilinia laxa TaxID=61186 RepID=A0A5N6KH91_MONLA|nr:hypothetical protein EYC80_004602 [Monilinia laxa]